MTPLDQSLGKPVSYLGALAALVGVLLIGFVVLFGSVSWRAEKADQIEQMQTVLELTEKGLDRYFIQAQTSLSDLAQDIVEAGGLADLNVSRRLLQRYAALHPDTTAVSLIRLDGQVLATSGADRLDGLPTLANDGSFQRFVDSIRPTTELDLSHPRMGSVSKRWVFPMRYVMRDDAGHPMAYVTSSVPVTLLQGFWSEAPAIKRVSLGLIRDDGHLLSRYPVPGSRDPAELYVTQRSGTFAQHLRAASFPANGYVEGSSRLSGEPLAYAYMRLEHFPVTLFTSMPIAEFREAWWARVRVPYMLVLVLALTGLFGYRMAWRRQRVWEGERSLSEQGLRASEEEQRFLLDNIVAGVVMYGPNRAVMRCNPRALQLLGVTEAQITGNTLPGVGLQLLHEDGRVMRLGESPLERVLATREPQRAVVVGVRRSESEQPVWLLSNLTPEVSGDVLRRVVVSFVDISARKRAEQILERSERRFRLMFEHSLEGLVKTRPDGTVLGANPAACAMMRMTEAALIARGRDRVIDTRDPRLKSLLERRDRDGHAASEVTMIRGDETRFEAEISTSVYVDEHGERVCSVVLRDVTDRRRAEAALAAQQLAENANRAKSQFLAHMSHELRTPLNAILGFSEVLQLDERQPLKPRQREQVRHIHRAGEHLLAMINDLLDLSRVEAGAMTLSIANIDPLEIIRSAVRDLTPIAAASGVGLLVSASSAPLGLIRGDATRFRQIVLNLLSNAVKYNIPNGKASVGIESDHAGRKLMLTVCDTGIGMSADQIDRLFKPFDRLGREDSGIEGTGIGMVITRGLVELMQGRLMVSSSVGAGSEFQVELPWVPAAPGATVDASRAERQSPDLSSPVPLRAPPVRAAAPADGQAVCHVLYIDDDPINRLLVEALLDARTDVRLSVAGSGAEGLRLVCQLHPDLVLIDMMMPVMSGRQVLGAIRADPDVSSTRCIAVSASAMKEEIEMALDAGFDGYLTKPLPPAALMPEIDRTVASVAARDPVRPRL
ncbi:hypothetical protein BH09PSE5_BH09PSE5_44360 [soil metagenome]